MEDVQEDTASTEPVFSTTPRNWTEVVTVVEARYTLGDDGVAFILSVIHHIGDVTETEDAMGYVYRADDPYSGAMGVWAAAWLSEHIDEVLPYIVPPPAPPRPYNFPIGTLWERMTDDEAEEFDTATATASPLKTRKQFLVATSMMSDGDLFAWVKAILVGLLGEARARELLAS
jgi:hypothetical protein